MRAQGGAAAWVAVLIGAVALLSTTAEASAAKRSVRVGPEYFGVNYPLMAFDAPTVRERQLAAIKRAGINAVRVPISWHQLEPNRPRGGVHHYHWYSSDLQVTLLARHGLRMMPVFFYPPSWASARGFGCSAGGYLSAGTDKLDDYADAAAALARRYGPRGKFWREHRELPELPIRTWQIWNEPNQRSFWCPEPDPGGYAELFVRAASAIKKARPSADVITAGLIVDAPRRRYMPVNEFLGKATATRPEIWRLADAVGAHIYPGKPLNEQFPYIRRLRDLMTAGGVPKRKPMFASEIGWGLGFGLSEAERAALYRYVTERIPSTNCNVSAMYAHSWTTTDPTGIFYDNATGIANVFTGEPLPSAVAFSEAIALLRGRGPREAVHPRMSTCKGMPKLDRDRDREPEHRDYHPMDRKLWRGPAEWYGDAVLDARRVQRLGRPVRVRVFCGRPCSAVARGTLHLRGAETRLRLNRAKARGDDGDAAVLTLGLGRRAKRAISEVGAAVGKALVKVTARGDDGKRHRLRIRVKLR